MIVIIVQSQREFTHPKPEGITKFLTENKSLNDFEKFFSNERIFENLFMFRFVEIKRK